MSLDKCRKLLEDGKKSLARQAILDHLSSKFDSEAIRLWIENFPLQDASERRLETLENSDLPFSKRAKALSRALDDPRFGFATLDLLEDMVDAEKPLSKLPLDTLFQVVAPAHAPKLLRIFMQVRKRYDSSPTSARRRAADHWLLRELLDYTGITEPPTLMEREFLCDTCKWPAAYYCRDCLKVTCGKDECSYDDESQTTERLGCDHRGGEFSVIRTDQPQEALVRKRRRMRSLATGDDHPLQPLKLTEEWQIAGEVAVDSGTIGVVPVGGGKSLRTMTSIGDGCFEAEFRVGRTSEHVEVRISLTSNDAGSQGRWRDLAPGATRSGLFLLGDPILGTPMLPSVETLLAAIGSERVAKFGNAVLIRAATVSGKDRWVDERNVELLLQFSPRIN